MTIENIYKCDLCRARSVKTLNNWYIINGSKHACSKCGPIIRAALLLLGVDHNYKKPQVPPPGNYGDYLPGHIDIITDKDAT